ncbi:MAG: peptidoglycan DD-metalloendopeptidase family protein [Methylotenera sp.]|uniref:murein hydrolase activator EnvC family protein n=1 Tax=Methylotenera sp. TaxID=2051956 RepID=UPI00248A8CC5|nr:peptidoglycan DD-metalloendopeptidase family protein [Methylotenera sp.]MDI1310356.1 peptidoglycan DD-metalloendopeptidase family protein [Methylotenera sp.]
MKYKHVKSRLAWASLLMLMLACVPCANANKKEQSKQNLNDVQQRLEALKKKLDNSQEAHKDAADALKESEQAISAANKKLYEINQKQQQNKKTLTQLKSESFSANQALSQQQKLLSAQLYQQYIQGQQSYLQMVLQNESPSEIARDVQYYSYVAKARATLINQMQGNLNKISKLNNATASTLKQVADLKQKQVDEKRALESQKKEKSKVVSSLSQQIASQRSEIKKLTRDEKRLSELVARLAKIIPPPPKKARPKREPTSVANKPENSNNNKPPKEVLANNIEPSQEFSDSNFAALKGKLRLPVRGDVTNRFGSSREDTGISWKGLFIKASEGAEVKSVATGRVVFADWLRGFGNLIILDHGNGFMSLYGNNQAVLKQVGDSVRPGDVIASVGNSGGNQTNGLYYELRSQSRPFDPLSWSKVN